MQTLAQALPAVADISKTPITQPTTPFEWRPRLDEYEPTLTKAADECARLIAGMKANADPHWLTLSGMSGCGKTMLARAVFAEAQTYNPGAESLWLGTTRRPRVVWLDATEMFRRMTENEEFDLPEYLRDDYFVVLDDLGAARDKSGFLKDALYRFANHRLGRWTMYTTNLTHRELSEQIDARVASRLIRDGNTAVRIAASDYALRKGAA